MIATFGWAQQPIGEEFQVNTYTTDAQVVPAITANSQGNFIVVWESDGSYGTDTANKSIQAQRYDVDGIPIGGEFQVNTYTPNAQRLPSAAMDGSGNFLVVWESRGSFETDSSNTSIQGQQYNSGGTPLGGQFQVNTFTPRIQTHPRVAATSQGAFVVVWESDGSYGSDTAWTSIQGQRYDATGAPQGGQFQINSHTPGGQAFPAIAVDELGNFVVVWHSGTSPGTDASDKSIQGQRFDSAGTPMGGQFQVNTFTTGGQTWPEVAIDALGNFIVVWNGPEVQAQRYAANGQPVGDQFQVNTYTKFTDPYPDVASDAEGNFLVSWWSYGSYWTDTSYSSVQGQFFNADGSASGGQFQVNTYTPGEQGPPAVTADPEGRFIVVWESEGSQSGSDTSGTSIVAGQFLKGIFQDGFETGDTSRWAITEP